MHNPPPKNRFAHPTHTCPDPVRAGSMLPYRGILAFRSHPKVKTTRHRCTPYGAEAKPRATGARLTGAIAVVATQLHAFPRPRAGAGGSGWDGEVDDYYGRVVGAAVGFCQPDQFGGRAIRVWLGS